MSVVVITGAAGLVGSMLRPRLARPGRTLRILDIAPLTAGPGEGATVTPPGAQAIPPPPVVLECDLQVRERLRFLLWMRRIQSDELRAEIARPARVAHPGPARP